MSRPSRDVSIDTLLSRAGDGAQFVREARGELSRQWRLSEYAFCTGIVGAIRHAGAEVTGREQVGDVPTDYTHNHVNRCDSPRERVRLPDGREWRDS